MKTARFIFGAAACVMLSACANTDVSIKQPETVKSCYPVNSLNASQRAVLYAGRGNPILLAGGERIVCACYHGADEKDRLAGADEKDRLAGADEKDRLAGADEKDRLAGDFAELFCRIKPKCSGFELIGYAPEQITVLTEAGRKSVPTNCITW